MLVDLDAVGGNWPSENDSYEVLLDRALFEVGDVDACGVSVCEIYIA